MFIESVVGGFCSEHAEIHFEVFSFAVMHISKNIETNCAHN